MTAEPITEKVFELTFQWFCETFKPGDKFTGFLHGTKYHVIAAVKEEQIVVVKSWLPRKQRWHFEVFDDIKIHVFKHSIKKVK